MVLRRRQAVPLLIAASLLLHRLLLASIPAAPSLPQAARTDRSLVEFSIATGEPAEAPRSRVEPLSRPESARVSARVPVGPHPRTRTAMTETSTPSQPAQAARPLEAASSPARTPGPARAAAPDLSPRALAIASVADRLEDAAATERRVDEPDLATERGRELAAGLAAAANARPSRSRGSPQLERDPDGTCHYEGEAVIATIRPDGGVEFVDRPGRVERKDGPDEPPEVPLTPEEMVAPQRLEVGWKYTPRAWTAEREWFLRETAELRSQLSHAARERELARAGARLEQELERIWCDGSRSAERRREAIFTLWSEASDDEVGARARRIVIDFVRRNLPAADEQAYTRQELARLNASHLGHGRFDPYADGDAGVRD